MSQTKANDYLNTVLEETFVIKLACDSDSDSSRVNIALSLTKEGRKIIKDRIKRKMRHDQNINKTMITTENKNKTER